MVTRPFRARSRILSLLGDQLIGRDYLAVFELVKNSFDADASFSRVKVEGLDQGDPVITVCDDGH
ncbi:MAG: ATP-binding protein [Alphaproteobacteria bacterium]|nr:ATP-binding protein [Alphaproteobacteria bacterium]